MRSWQSRLLRVIALTAVFTFFAWTIRLAVSGGSGSGSTSITDVPYIGGRFGDLPAVDDVAYSYERHPHGGVVWLSGVVSRAELTNFCEASGTTLSSEGIWVASRDHVLEYLGNHSPQRRVPQGWPGDVDAETMILSCYAGRFPKLYGTWDPVAERFWMIAHFSE